MRTPDLLAPECDETHWPLAILLAEARLDAEGVRSGLDSIERWLAYEKPFALLLIAVCGSIFRSDAAELAMVAQRIGEARNALRRFLLGVAVVVPSTTAGITLAAQGLSRLRLDMPLQIFDRSPQAAEWLRSSILAPAGLVVDSL